MQPYACMKDPSYMRGGTELAEALAEEIQYVRK